MDIEEVVSLATVATLAPDDALQAIAQLVDFALDQGDPALTTKALDWCDEVESRLTSDSQRIHLGYFRANAWAHRQSTRHADRSAAWAWDQEELQQQVYFLRRASSSPAFDQLPVLRRCQVLTNLANQFDTVGRFIEARMLWGDALSARPEFWMARANRGRGLTHYAHALYDPGHAAVFAFEAHKDLVQALRHIDEYLNVPTVLVLCMSGIVKLSDLVSPASQAGQTPFARDIELMKQNPHLAGLVRILTSSGTCLGRTAAAAMSSWLTSLHSQTAQAATSFTASTKTARVEQRPLCHSQATRTKRRAAFKMC